ncbi:MAG: hypothetical protein NTV34_17585 [Proteobacteria bacterium]|nr:hypothetical protein [Pseudomonadota bacterium]
MKSLVLLVVVLVISCKSGNKAGLESLDSLAGGTGNATCSASPTPQFTERYETFWAQKSIVAEAGYKDALSSVFAAIPVELQSWFFLKGGKVQLIGNPGDFCKSRNATPLFFNTGEIGGCMYLERLGSEVRMPVIYLGITGRTHPEQIEQASLVVQGFAAVLSSFLSEVGGGQKLESDGNLRYLMGGSDSEMRNVKTGLAFMVIEDLIKMKRPDGKTYAEAMPDQFKGLIKSSGAFDTTKDRNTRWTSFWNSYNELGHRDFTNYIVGQVFEAKWCNGTTRAVLAEGAAFRDTGAYFAKEVEPMFTAALAPVQAGTQLAEPEVISTGSGAMAAAPSLNNAGGMALGERVFPVLGAIIRAPFAVTEYFVENRPVKSFFQTYQPVRSVFVGALRAVGAVGQFAVQGAGNFLNTISDGRVGSGQILGRIGYHIENGCLIRRWRC